MSLDDDTAAFNKRTEELWHGAALIDGRPHYSPEPDQFTILDDAALYARFKDTFTVTNVYFKEPNMNEPTIFQVGDLVRCINGSEYGRLETGKTYTVHAANSIYIGVVAGRGVDWSHSRFELVERKPACSAVTISAEANKTVFRETQYDAILDALRHCDHTAPALEKLLGIKAHKRLPEMARLGLVKLTGRTSGTPKAREWTVAGE